MVWKMCQWRLKGEQTSQHSTKTQKRSSHFSHSAQWCWQLHPDPSPLCWSPTPPLPGPGSLPPHRYLSPRWPTAAALHLLAADLNRGEYIHIQVDKHARLHAHAHARTHTHMGGHTIATRWETLPGNLLCVLRKKGNLYNFLPNTTWRVYV